MNSLQPVQTTINGHATAAEPVLRPRRMRISPALRQMVRETTLSPADFIYPLFVRYGEGERRPDRFDAGAVSAFGRRTGEGGRFGPGAGHSGGASVRYSAGKGLGAEADNFNPHGVVPEAIRALKEAAPELIVISDMCFCEYTDHGHCGIINSPTVDSYKASLPEGYLLNDPTLELLGRASVVHAEAGADIIAPSAMLDGMVAAIRGALDGAGLEQCAGSELRGEVCQQFLRAFPRGGREPAFFWRPQPVSDGPGQPPRGAEGGCAGRGGGGRHDHGQARAALSGCSGSGAGGRSICPRPAYQVSGEYAMLHAAAANGWLDLEKCALESLTSIKRAGADMILTYFAKDAAHWLAGKQ